MTAPSAFSCIEAGLDPAEADRRFMRRAIKLARLGELRTSPNPMVGAVIVGPDGHTVLAEGWHRQWGEGHAEVNAVRDLPESCSTQGCTLYVTLEPCSHRGKTPPCAAMLVERGGWKRVVVGMVDPNPLVSGRGIAMLRDAGIEVTLGVCEEECRALNPHFLTAQTLGRPWVTLKWAESADGYIDGRNRPDDPPALISSAVTKTLVHRERALHDAILVGRGTWLADSPTLHTTRYAGRSPKRVLLTSSLEKAPEGWILLREVSEAALRNLMQEHGISSILVEGGAHTLESFIKAGLFDAIRVETNPCLFLADHPYKVQSPVTLIGTGRAKKVLNNIQTLLPTHENGLTFAVQT